MNALPLCIVILFLLIAQGVVRSLFIFSAIDLSLDFIKSKFAPVCASGKHSKNDPKSCAIVYFSTDKGNIFFVVLVNCKHKIIIILPPISFGAFFYKENRSLS